MYRGKKITAWIPFGRELTVSILLPYLLKEREVGTVDEIWLCMNTDPEQVSDREYAERAARKYRIKLVTCPGPDTPELRLPNVTGTPAQVPGNEFPRWADGYEPIKQRNTGRFPLYMQDRNAVFVRFDDDIVWVHPRAIPIIVDRVLDSEALAVFPLIWNNAISSWFAQQHGLIPREWGLVGAGTRNSLEVSAVDPVGWGDPIFAEKLHGMVLDRLEAGAENSLALEDELRLGTAQQYSVSCFGIGGEQYADLKGVLSFGEEEHWLTKHRPGEIGRVNIVSGWAQVAHFSFLTQREYLLANTDCLDRYRALSKAVEASL